MYRVIKAAWMFREVDFGSPIQARIQVSRLASLAVAGRGFSFKFLESSLVGRTCIYCAFPRSGCSILLLPGVFQISSSCSPRGSKGNENAPNLLRVTKGNEIGPFQNDPMVISLSSNWKPNVGLWTSMLQCQYMGPVV